MRVGAVAAAAAFAAASTAAWFYGQYDHEPPGGRQLWFGTPAAAILVGVLAVAAGALAGRAWALLLALAPLVLAVPLHLAGRRGDFHDPYLPLENPFLYLSIGLSMLVIGLGLLVRRATLRARRRS